MKCYNRKDCFPDETIKNIKKILKKNNIKVKESKIINVNNNFFSVRLVLKNIPDIGVNGKGISRKYALASAYAEFMERLQSKFLLRPYFLNKENEISSFADEEYMDELEILKYKDIIKDTYTEEFVKCNPEYRYVSFFYDVFEKKEIKLPIKIINLLTHSNGLASGNTENEALVQGICEILERYCYKQILLKEYNLPNVEVEITKNDSVYKYLNSLKKMGLSYEIKDCSLNGIFPVVGIIIYNRKKDKYLFSIGSDPDFNIALQRCITEIFQGLSDSSIENKMKYINNEYEFKKKTFGQEFILSNWLKCYSSNSGIHPKNFFINNQYVKLESLPFYEIVDNNQALDVLLKILKKNCFKVYKKSYSYLGFNTYKIYIPTLSEIDELDVVRYEVSKNMTKLKEMYFNVYDVCDANNEELEKILLKIVNSERYSELISPDKLFNVNGYIKCEYTTLKFSYLLLIIYLINKDFEKAMAHVRNMQKKQNLSTYEREYLSSVLYCLKGEHENKKHYSFMIEDAKKLVFMTKKYLMELNAPSCPNCNLCRNKKNCKYKEWKKINYLISKKSIKN